jgi:hypothetical protein
MPIKDGSVSETMLDYSVQYPRDFARRLRIFLSRDRIVFGRDRTALIWVATGPLAPAKKPKKRYRSQNRRSFAAAAPNDVRAYDFVSDGCANGGLLKFLTIVDEFTKVRLSVGFAGLISSKRLI